MPNTNEKTIIIWAFDKYVEIINKAIEQCENINFGILFEVVTKTPTEIEDELSSIIP